jgi:phenylacetate-CoA ligase
VVDSATGAHVKPGDEGEAVITFLDSEASPLLRFATGDKVRYLGWTCCPCGRPLPGLESGTITRYDDMLKVKGVNFWPAAVDTVVLADAAVEDYRGRVFLDEQGRERIALRVRFRGGGKDPASTLIPALEEELRQRIGLTMKIEPVEQLEGAFRDERTKARRWRDDRRH